MGKNSVISVVEFTSHANAQRDFLAALVVYLKEFFMVVSEIFF